MGGALMEIMKDEVDKKVDAGKQEVTVNYIKDVMDSFGVTIEKAMSVLKIPQTEWETYAGLVNKKM